nr:MAG TPA: hypothetical protein [Caudoviricetes sp.]
MIFCGKFLVNTIYTSRQVLSPFVSLRTAHISSIRFYSAFVILAAILELTFSKPISLYLIAMPD